MVQEETFSVDSKTKETLKQRIERRIKELDERIESVNRRKEEPEDIRIVINTERDGFDVENIEKNKIRSVVQSASKPGQVTVSRNEDTGVIIYRIS